MGEQYIHQSRIRQVFFLSIVVLLGILLASEFAVFLPGFLGATTLYIVMRHPMLYLMEKKRWSRSLTAWMLILASFVTIMIPIGGLIGMLSSKVAFAIDHSLR